MSQSEVENPWDMRLGSGLTDLVSDRIDDDENQLINKFRVQFSLGSKLGKVSYSKEDGYSVEYKDGDSCTFKGSPKAAG